MLTWLSIKNFTIIDNLELELLSGMTVLTGETGAGKSILIDALALALGGSADSNCIRVDAERCEISAQFDISQLHTAKTWLIEHELAEHDDCVLRRILNRDGRSRSFINSQVVSQQALRELSDLLVNIHGQHEHQNLLKRDEQRALVDQYANHLNIMQEVNNLYQEWHNKQKELTDLSARVQQQEQQKELLQFHLQELENLALSENFLINLEQEHQRLANADKLINQCTTALQVSSEGEPQNAVSLLKQAQNHLANIAQLEPKISNARELFTNAMLLAEEAAGELRHYLADLSLDPERLQTIERQLSQIHDLARKHRIKPQELPALQDQLQQSLAEIEQIDSRQQALEQQITKLSHSYQQAAAKLSTSRKQAAEQLSKAVTANMQTLGMAGGQLHIAIEPLETFTRYGLERIEFLVSINPGQPLQPLTKVASGGELSRISLAIQVITAQQDNTPTLIFDEVDVGIGGGVAEIVGQLLRKLGNKAQVLCVTHLPQVAAQGSHHLQVSKSTQQHQTTTQIQLLSQLERKQEIARMLGGIKITENTLAHADEMLRLVEA